MELVDGVVQQVVQRDGLSGPVPVADEVFEEPEEFADLTRPSRLPTLLSGVAAVVSFVAGHDVVRHVHELGDVGLGNVEDVLVVEEANDLHVAAFLPEVVLSYLFEQSNCVAPSLFGEKVDPGKDNFLGTTGQTFVHVPVFLVLGH